VRALINIIILEKNQPALIKKLKEIRILRTILDMLNRADTEVLKSSAERAQSFCLFVTHSFRLFILCLYVDRHSLDPENSEEENQVNLR
jgi:predicted transcriptional regulator